MMSADFTFDLNRLTTGSPLILGLGREGWSSYRFWREKRPQQPIFLSDDLSFEKLPTNFQTQLQNDPLATFKTSTEWQVIIETESAPWEIVIKTPGLPPHHPLVKSSKSHNWPVTNNTQLFYEALAEFSPRPIVIGVTGTKGKSTTTSLIYQVLQTAQLPVVVGGNIGKPALDLLPELSAFAQSNQVSYVVLELSAHQLSDMSASIDVAVIQDIVPEHLDYYENFETYLAAKARIVLGQQPNQVVIYNAHLTQPRQMASQSQAQALSFTTHMYGDDDPARPAAYIRHQTIFYQDEAILNTAAIPLLGKHNLENVMPAVIIGKWVGLSNSQIAKGVGSFRALPHRLQLVAEVKGVRYFDDSLSTTPQAAQAALQAFNGTNVILIAGGYDRHLDFTELAGSILQQKVKKLILFPPTGELIKEEITKQAQQNELPLPAINLVTSMTEAVSAASQDTQSGDVVLLSPASASFGLFKDYQDRGEQFKAAALSLR
jgi:UDP-N-acetylmuramoylalanine--D-glutamate ligase